MKLPKRAQREIQEAIDAINVGIAFIQKPSTNIVIETSVTSMPEHRWTSGTGKAGMAIEKFIGSELCYLYSARDRLKRIITPVVVEHETI